MIQDIAPHVYHNQFSSRPVQPEDTVLAYSAAGLLCRHEDGALILPTLAQLQLDPARCLRLFSIDETDYALWWGQPVAEQGAWQYRSTRWLRSLQADHRLFAMAVGESLWRWYRSNRFCGSCGGTMAPGTTERSLVCRSCGHIVYPKICPAVIAAVYDGDRLLLSRYQGRATTHYALIAGYNEIGETIEETVRREVREEVGLEVGKLTFYGSQPWVFTDTLLMGFFAQLEGSDQITLQEEELSEAIWFHRQELPTDHSAISLTGEMIEYFRSCFDGSGC